MLIKKPADIRPSEITPPEWYARRREFLKGAAVLGAAFSSSSISIFLPFSILMMTISVSFVLLTPIIPEYVCAR